MLTIKEITQKNGLSTDTRDYSTPKHLPNITKWIIAEYGWDKERSFRIFLKQAKRKEMNRFMATYQTCCNLDLKTEATRAMLDVVCCCGIDWNQAEKDWVSGEEE